MGHIRRVEVSMRGSFDRSGRNDNGINEKWGLGFLALPVLLAIAMVALTFI
jgi:hypothetical protein